MRFHEPKFIGGGVMLFPEEGVYVPYRYVDGKRVTGDPTPLPQTEDEIDRLHAMADGRFQPPEIKDHDSPAAT